MEARNDRPTLLVVDDDRTTLKTLSRALGREFTIVSVADGADVCRLARVLHPSGIILDLCLGTHDGIKLLDLLRSDPDTADIPVLAVSGLRLLRRLSLEHGARSFLAKPFLTHDLFSQVHGLLDGAHPGATS